MNLLKPPWRTIVPHPLRSIPFRLPVDLSPLLIHANSREDLSDCILKADKKEPKIHFLLPQVRYAADTVRETAKGEMFRQKPLGFNIQPFEPPSFLPLPPLYRVLFGTALYGTVVSSNSITGMGSTWPNRR